MPAAPLPDARQRTSGGIVVAGGVLAALVFVWVMLTGSYDAFGAFILGVVVLALTVPLARHAARVEGRAGYAWMVMGAMVLKLAGAGARYFVAYGLYGGVADASTYTSVALRHYHRFRHLHVFAPTTGVFHGLIPWIDTVVYALAGPTEMGSFFVFSWISFVGAYLFWRAFRTAYPEGDGRRYALLVFFLPSMLYWPSSLGKEAWMVFALGLASFGLARILAQRFGGYLGLAAGIGAMILVRPHLALIFLPAAILAFLFRRSRPGRRRHIGRVVGIVVLVGCSLLVISKAESYFGIKNLDPTTVTKELKTVRGSTDIGNSAFNPPNAKQPVGFVEAVVTTLYRPFPWEAHSLTVLLASGEGLVLIGITVASRRRLLRLPRVVWRNPYLLYCLAYTLLFVFAFSNFSNFGILARERVQLFPMFLAMLAVPAAAAAVEATSDPASPPLSRQATAAVVPPQVMRAGRAGPADRPAAAAILPPVPYRGRRRLPASATAGTGRRFGPEAQRAGRAGRPLGPYAALGYRFDVAVEDPGHVPDIERILSDLADPGAGPPAHHLRLRTTGEDGAVTVEVDGERRGSPGRMPHVLETLVSELNALAATSRPDDLVVHAAALAWGDVGLLLPGPPGSGKSTLAAALVAAGFGYLTDEAAAVDRRSGTISPYPKPISLRPGSRAALALSVPEAAGGGGRNLLLGASTVRPAAVAGPVRAELLVFPTYDPGAGTSMRPLHRATGLVELANNSFNFVDHGGDWLESLRTVILGCTCWRLTVGDLGTACRMLTDAAHQRENLSRLPDAGRNEKGAHVTTGVNR